MTVFSVYEPASDDDDVAARAEKIAFVKDGFSWPAFLVPVLWLLYQRMWIELVAFLVVIGGLQWALGGSVQGLELAGWITLAITVLFGFWPNPILDVSAVSVESLMTHFKASVAAAEQARSALAP